MTISYEFPYSSAQAVRPLGVSLDGNAIWSGYVGQSGTFSFTYDFSSLSPGAHRLTVEGRCINTVWSFFNSGSYAYSTQIIHKDPDDIGPKCPSSPTVGHPINLGSGNMWLQHADVSLPGPNPLVFTRTFNSKTTSSMIGVFGGGWSHTYETRLYSFGGTGWKLILGDGTVEYYIDNDGDGTYETMLPRDLGTTFKRTQAAFVRTTREGTSWEFDLVSRRLLAVRDRNGNAVTLAYDAAGRVSTMTDSFGRTLTLAYGADGKPASLTLPDGGKVTYGFDPYGRFATAADPEGAVTTYQWDNYGRLAKVLDANGHVMEAHTYDAKGRAVTSEKDGGNEKVSISYLDDLTVQVTNSKGQAATYVLDKEAGRSKVAQVAGAGCVTCGLSNTAYTYDVNGFKASETDGNGNVTTYHNDARGNVLQKTEAVGTPQERTTVYTYTPDNQVATITVKSAVDPTQSKTTTFEYDAKGNLAKRTEAGLLGDGSPYSYVTTYTYTESGQIASIDAPRTDASDVTAFTYYPVVSGDPDSGQLFQVSQPGGLTTTYAEYNWLGKPQTVSDPNGNVTTYAYDARGRVKSVTVAGDTTTYSYDPVGNLVRIALPMGNAVDYVYDGVNRLVRITDALGNSVNYSYDTEGNRTKEEIKDATGALQKTLSFQHDALNRLTRIVNPDSTYTEYGYDARGSRTSLKNPNGNTTTYQYDSLNRLASVTPSPLGGGGPGVGGTTYAYNTQDGLTSVTDANGHVTTYKYDDMGRVYQVLSPDTGTTTYGYDPAGNLVQKTDAKGINTAYQYDALNRLTKIDFPADGDVIYAYDSCPNGKGRLCGTTDQAGTASYEYSAKGELVKETKVIQGRTYVTSYSFDKNGNLSTITYPSGRKGTYAFDAADRVTGVTTTPYRGTAQTAASSISHKPFGGIASMTYGNGLARSVGYDQQYRITGIQTGAVQNVSYTHDPNGNITGITDNVNPTKTKNFGYDSLDRLASATGPWGSLSWTYDPVGNRQTQVENGATSTYSYQSGTNRLTSVSGASPLSFALDANGNTTTENAKTFTYNQNNRLIKASESATLGEYTFNANGQRATKKAGSLTRVFHHDQSGNIIAETTSAGATVAEYVWLDGQPLAKLDTGGTRYIHPDHLGTPQLMTNSTGTVVWQIEAKPFGDGASITGTATLNMRFPGQYFDSETGLHQNWNREYVPGVGRYFSPDPLSVQAANYHENVLLGILLSVFAMAPADGLTRDMLVKSLLQQWKSPFFEPSRIGSNIIDALTHQPADQHPYVYAMANPTRLADRTGTMSGAGGVVVLGGVGGFLGLCGYCMHVCFGLPGQAPANDGSPEWWPKFTRCATLCISPIQAAQFIWDPYGSAVTTVVGGGH